MRYVRIVDIVGRINNKTDDSSEYCETFLESLYVQRLHCIEYEITGV